MAGKPTEKSIAIRQLVRDEMLAGRVVDCYDLAESYGMSVRSIQRFVEEITAVLPKEMIPKKLASEKQIGCGIGHSKTIGPVTDTAAMQAIIGKLSHKQVSALIQVLGSMRKTKAILKSNFGLNVVIPVLNLIDLRDYPYKKR